MKKTTGAIIAALALAGTMVGAGVASADGWGRGHDRGGPHGKGHHGRMAAELMERYDTNGDGRITQEEIDAVQATRFADAAAGGDAVTLDNFKTFWLQEHDERVVRAFQRLDRDGDGRITAEEFNRRTDGLVERLDRDGDGALSRVDRPRGPHHDRRGPQGDHERGERGPGRDAPPPPPPAGDAPESAQ
ncbi:EF-hand domain-containing protein [Methylobrevis albus]|uniref:EF-hand domain-containing protein n=1 Tax=Methylobrevis albus TaxID=2793297 RepID=A0A931MZX1_9HYPH|nr:EF-hand domain-containing protein [Methylobrevis albus]MBH0238554.1 EF-hand domain-containing protein [Methylobrevis albus]